MTVSLSLFAGAGQQFFDNNGVPLAGGKVYTYTAGTTTPEAAYTTSAGNVAHTNPIVLDAAGRVPSGGEIWLTTTVTYKFVVETSTGVLIATYDNVNAASTAKDLQDFIDKLANANNVAEGDALVAFRQSNASGAYSGTIARTVHQKLQETVSIADFGASPSATGSVNRAAIVAALAASKSVYAPPGIYTVTGDTITIPDNTEFFGAGKYATTINFTPDGDKDCFVIGWYTTLRDMKIVDQYASAGSFGLLRLQSLTNSEIPTNVGGNDWRDPSIGGLSYKNNLHDLVLESGHNYNIYMVNVAYISFRNVRAVLSRNASGNVSIWGKGGANMPVSTTVYMAGSNEFTASLAGPGLTLQNINNSYLQFIAEGNKGRGVTATGDLTNLTFKQCYLESNFAQGAATGDAEMVITGNTTNVVIEDSWFFCNNSYRGFTISPGYTYTGLNIARSCTVPVTGINTGGVVNFPTDASGWSIQFNNDFLTNNVDDYNDPLLRAQGKLWPRQIFNTSPFSFIRNSLFKTWTLTEPDGWSTPFSAAPVIKNTASGYYKSPNSMQFNTYPSAASYLGIQNNFEWAQKNYCLVLVGKNGKTVSSATPGYDGVARTYVAISVGATNYFLDIPETTFDSEWTAYQWDLAALFGASLPPKNTITTFSLYLCCTAGTIIGHAGIYANDAPYQIPE